MTQTLYYTAHALKALSFIFTQYLINNNFDYSVFSFVQIFQSVPRPVTQICQPRVQIYNGHGNSRY